MNYSRYKVSRRSKPGFVIKYFSHISLTHDALYKVSNRLHFQIRSTSIEDKVMREPFLDQWFSTGLASGPTDLS